MYAQESPNLKSVIKDFMEDPGRELLNIERNLYRRFKCKLICDERTWESCQIYHYFPEGCGRSIMKFFIKKLWSSQ